MRWLSLILFASIVSGCTSPADGAQEPAAPEAETGAEDDKADAQPAREPTQPMAGVFFDATIDVTSASTESGAVIFEAPVGEFTTIVVREPSHADLRYVGEHETRLVSPNGAAEVFTASQGAGYTSPAGGGVYTSGCLGCVAELPYEAGAWTVEYDVLGHRYLWFEASAS